MMRSLLFGLLVAPAIGCAQQVSCPLTVKEGMVNVKAPVGWQASSSLAHLGSAGMTRGNPRQLGYLVPTATKKANGRDIDSWTFAKGEEKWLWCGYGRETIQLAKRMNDATTRCEMTGREERPGVYAEITLVCN
jgi:hypothetical protein